MKFEEGKEPEGESGITDQEMHNLRRVVDLGFTGEESGLFRDIANAWSGVMADPDFIGSWSDDEMEARLPELLHYEEYYLHQGRENAERMRQESGDKAAEHSALLAQKELEFIRESSIPDKVAEYNALVDEFNNDRERIIRDRDIEALKRYGERAYRLIYGDKGFRAHFGIEGSDNEKKL